MFYPVLPHYGCLFEETCWDLIWFDAFFHQLCVKDNSLGSWGILLSHVLAFTSN